MTNPDEDPLSHAQKLENIVDDLGEKVADEREAAGAAGTRKDLDETVPKGSEDEPPD